MAVAATIGLAATLASENVQLQFQQATDSLNTLFTTFLAAIVTALPDPDSVNQRTVLNWVPVTRFRMQFLPSSFDSQDDANDMSVFLFRICQATAAAAVAGRITTAQRDAILAAYNTSFSA